MGMDDPRDKIYLVAIVDDPNGVIEHRFIEPYGNIDRHAEIGIFPKRLVEALSEQGYWDMVSFRAAEAIRLAIPLDDPSGYGAKAIETMAGILPQRRFISPVIHRVVATYDDAVSLFLRGDYQGAILVLREAIRLAIEMMRKIKGASEEVSTEDFIRETIGDEGVEFLRKALGFNQCDQARIVAYAEEMRQCAKRILAELGIPDDVIEG